MKADEKTIRYLFKELKKQGEDPEKVEDFLNNFLQKRLNPSIGTTRKAVLTDNIMHQLLGEAVLDEVEGIENLPLQEALEKIKETSNKGLSNLEKSVDISPKISIEDLSSQKAYGLQHPSIGTKVDKRFDVPDIATKQLGFGTSMHESSHSIDDVAKRVALAEDEMLRRSSPTYKEYFLKKSSQKNFKPTVLQMMSDDEFNRYYSQIKKSFEDYVKENPGKLEEMVKDAGVTKFSSQPVPDLLPNEFRDFSPTKLQNLYSGTGHWFKRNFPFENLKNALKKGVKGIKGVGVGMIPAAALTAISAYSPEASASPAFKTAEKVSEEGDLLSLLLPPEAGKGEEEEVKKMYEEAVKNKNNKNEENRELKKQIKNILEEPVRERKLGQQPDPDLEEMDKVFNYDEYLKKKKKQMGYE